jgi:GxxExxY protein
MTQSNTEKIYTPLTAREIWLANQIVNISITIHQALGPGLLESVYEKVFCFELGKRNIPYARQQPVDIIYYEFIVSDALKIDILLDDLVIIELKAQENPHPVWEAQLLSYLKLTNKRLGYILNFHTPLMKNGIKRMIL